MKKYLLFLSLSTLVFACGGGDTEKKKLKFNETGKETSDDPLLAKAKGVFQAIPDQAENPENPISPEKVALGKMLYYDTRLSLTGNNSCNSCHDLSKYGVDGEVTSVGDNGGRGTRNSPTVLNAALHGMQFWDGGAKDVEEQAGMPILNPVEMAIPNEAFLVKKLKGVEEYKSLFAKAFPGTEDPLTYKNITYAIAAFERTLLTPSRFDQYLKGDANALNEKEKEGLQLFMDVGCTTCHMGTAVGGGIMQKFGLYGDYRSFTGSTIPDEGKKAVTKNDADKDVFKTCSLRNVEKTAPYFHDGSVSDLKKAIDIMAKTELDKTLQPNEIESIEAFLKSLTGEVPKSALQ
jgi:cytochrome c peroxidase